MILYDFVRFCDRLQRVATNGSPSRSKQISLADFIPTATWSYRTSLVSSDRSRWPRFVPSRGNGTMKRQKKAVNRHGTLAERTRRDKCAGRIGSLDFPDASVWTWLYPSTIFPRFPIPLQVLPLSSERYRVDRTRSADLSAGGYCWRRLEKNSARYRSSTRFSKYRFTRSRWQRACERCSVFPTRTATAGRTSQTLRKKKRTRHWPVKQSR